MELRPSIYDYKDNLVKKTALAMFVLITLFVGTGVEIGRANGIDTLRPETASSMNPVGSGARAIGMGGAFIGVADDATAASWNPGGLLQLERPEASIMGSYFVRFEDQDVDQPETIVDGQTIKNANLNYLSGVYPFELFNRNIVVSLNYQRLFDLDSKTDVISRFDTIDGLQQVDSDNRCELRPSWLRLFLPLECKVVHP